MYNKFYKKSRITYYIRCELKDMCQNNLANESGRGNKKKTIRNADGLAWL
jgi:hypothetical protein